MDQDRERRLLVRLHDPLRLMALSDGVFAVVITLLVLEVHVPNLRQGQALATALRQIRPSLHAFLGLSFWIYAGAPVLYFAALLVSKAEAPPDAVERDFT